MSFCSTSRGRLTMPRTTYSNQFERKILQNIAKYGWHANAVGGEADSPSFAFGIVASAAENGRPFDLGQPTNALIRGYPAVFVRVPSTEYDPYVLSSLWYYDGSDFPLYQVVWPFKDGKFPWHESVPAQLRRSQPVLGVCAGGV